MVGISRSSKCYLINYISEGWEPMQGRDTKVLEIQVKKIHFVVSLSQSLAGQRFEKIANFCKGNNADLEDLPL